MTFSIPIPPVTKKNHMRIYRNRATGRPMLVQSDAYREYAELAAMFMPTLPRPIAEPVNVKCVFYMPTRRKVDKSNLEAAIHDILVECGVLADDCRDIIAATDGSRVYYDKAHPRTEITIEKLKETYEVWKK